MNNTEIMLAGLYSHTDMLKNYGVSPEFIARLEGIHHSICELNVCREALRLRLEAKTEEIDRQVTEMEKLYQEIKQVVKQELPQATWKDFGIE